MLFATNDPTGLAGQLLLMNRVLGKIGVSTSTLSPNIFSTSNQVLAMVQQLITDGKSIDDNATYLRRVVRVASILASISTDPIKSLDDSIAQIRTINTQKNTRLTSTQQYAIRVLNFRKKLYEEMINRDLKSAPLVQSTSKTSKKIDTNPSLDTTGDADLDAFLQLLASQG